MRLVPRRRGTRTRGETERPRPQRGKREPGGDGNTRGDTTGPNHTIGATKRTGQQGAGGTASSLSLPSLPSSRTHATCPVRTNVSHASVGKTRLPVLGSRVHAGGGGRRGRPPATSGGSGSPATNDSVVPPPDRLDRCRTAPRRGRLTASVSRASATAASDACTAFLRLVVTPRRTRSMVATRFSCRRFSWVIRRRRATCSLRRVASSASPSPSASSPRVVADPTDPDRRDCRADEEAGGRLPPRLLLPTPPPPPSQPSPPPSPPPPPPRPLAGPSASASPSTSASTSASASSSSSPPADERGGSSLDRPPPSNASPRERMEVSRSGRRSTDPSSSDRPSSASGSSLPPTPPPATPPPRDSRDGRPDAAAAAPPRPPRLRTLTRSRPARTDGGGGLSPSDAPVALSPITTSASSSSSISSAASSSSVEDFLVRVSRREGRALAERFDAGAAPTAPPPPPPPPPRSSLSEPPLPAVRATNRRRVGAVPEPRPPPLLRPEGRDDRAGEAEPCAAGGEPLRGRALDRPRVVEPAPAADAPAPEEDDGRVTQGTWGMLAAAPAPSSSLLSTMREAGRRERLRGIDGKLDVSSSMTVEMQVNPHTSWCEKRARSAKGSDRERGRPEVGAEWGERVRSSKNYVSGWALDNSCARRASCPSTCTYFVFGKRGPSGDLQANRCAGCGCPPGMASPVTYM